ncbi:MAG: hypothetical protein ACR2M6_00245 [Vampirovibrionia bacterium]
MSDPNSRIVATTRDVDDDSGRLWSQNLPLTPMVWYPKYLPTRTKR